MRAFQASFAVSIHAPRKGSDPTRWRLWSGRWGFNPRPPQGERPWPDGDSITAALFQSTPPARGATRLFDDDHITNMFQSTPPARGATCRLPGRRVARWVSIHAPRKGSDVDGSRGVSQSERFNPRPPQGERRGLIKRVAVEGVFQSTPPARGATPSRWWIASGTMFQSTPPARGATLRAHEAY